MNVSISWLKKYIDTNLSTEEICDKLTMTGTKMETIEKFGQKVENIVVGKVIDITNHNEDDKLKIVKIDIGKELTAIAKIADIEVGDLIPVALPGAVIEGKGEIKETEVKGIKSECMVCHIMDFGLSNKEITFVKDSGLIVFPEEVKVGSDVNSVLGLDDDIIEFEITPNRPDCLSVEGIARELAATINKSFTSITCEDNSKKTDNLNGITVEIDTNNCTRYTLKKVSNVIIKESPLWLQMTLIKSGIRPINNIVDITNYVMLEIGQPLHAFDADKINGNKIIVRQAKNGQKLETLDGVERNLTEDNMCICDTEKPIAIAGIIGGELSGIDKATKNVVFEAATFVRGSIRKTSRAFALRTEASSRYEKGLPEELTDIAIARVCELIKNMGIGKVEEEIIDICNKEIEQRKIKVDYDYINKFIGINLTKERMNEIFKSLEIEVKEGVAYIPYFRQDIEIMADLAEEIARINGYENIPSTKITGEQTTGKKDTKQLLEDDIKNTMVAQGYNEIYTYTFFNKESLNKLNISKKDDIVKDIIGIINPLSSDFTYLRTSSLPLIIDSLEKNYSKKNLDVKLFELAKIFIDNNNIPQGELPEERLVLTLGIYGKHDFYEIKGNLENLLKKLNISDYNLERYTDSPVYHPGESAKIVLNGETIGVFGKISPKVIKNFNLPDKVYIAEIYFDKLLKYQNKEVKFIELLKYPAVERDLAFTVSDEILSGDIIRSIKSLSERIERVELFDIYKGLQIAAGQKSMAYSIYLRDKEKTLNEQEINEIMDNIIINLEQKYEAKVRK